MNKYLILIKILLSIAKEAPVKNKRYNVIGKTQEQLITIYSRTYIHFFLKVKFGLLDFEERENYITDDSADGNIDAYYVDTNTEIIYLIQSKFGASAENFISKDIASSDLLIMRHNMERIIDGDVCYDNGTSYNKKILQMQKVINKLPNIGRYKYEIIILSNINNKLDKEIKSLFKEYEVNIYNHEKFYRELMFPLLTSTFYLQDELQIALNFKHKPHEKSSIEYNVTTRHAQCLVRAVFVPTIEIGKILSTYKNAILEYNPRNYLELEKGKVNSKIQKSILDYSTNEFAILNNGITFLCNDSHINDKIMKKNHAQLVLTKPQIINGGQTAYTLSRIYDKCKEKNDFQDFDEKEVFLKIISISDKNFHNSGKKTEFIEQISKATNEQTQVDEIDRKANEIVNKNLQKNIYDHFGFFYERKKGEFNDSIKNRFIDKKDLIKRDIFTRIALSISGNPSLARGGGLSTIIKRDDFMDLFTKQDYKSIIFGYLVFKETNQFLKENRTPKDKYISKLYGNAFRYGRYAITYACSLKFEKDFKLEEYEIKVSAILKEVLSFWKDFEISASKKKANSTYFVKRYDEITGEEITEPNFANYYKGNSLKTDIDSYLKKNNFVIKSYKFPS